MMILLMQQAVHNATTKMMEVVLDAENRYRFQILDE